MNSPIVSPLEKNRKSHSSGVKLKPGRDEKPRNIHLASVKLVDLIVIGVVFADVWNRRYRQPI